MDDMGLGYSLVNCPFGEPDRSDEAPGAEGPAEYQGCTAPTGRTRGYHALDRGDQCVLAWGAASI